MFSFTRPGLLFGALHPYCCCWQSSLSLSLSLSRSLYLSLSLSPSLIINVTFTHLRPLCSCGQRLLCCSFDWSCLSSSCGPLCSGRAFLYYNILYHIISYHIISYYTILYYTILYYTRLDYTRLCYNRLIILYCPSRVRTPGFVPDARWLQKQARPISEGLRHRAGWGRRGILKYNF